MVNFWWWLIRPFAWLARWIRKFFARLFGQLSYRPLTGSSAVSPEPTSIGVPIPFSQR